MMLQSILTALLVLASAVYATWRLLTARQRLRLIERLFPEGRARPRWLAKWRTRALADAMRGCQACSGAGHAKRHPRRA